MAMNKVIFIFTLLAISMVESRTLTNTLEQNKPAIAEASSRVEADPVKVNADKLTGALPRNLAPDTVVVKDTKPASSSRPIRATDATSIRMKVDRAKPIRLREYKPTWLIDNPRPVMIGEDNIEFESNQVTDQPPEGTATVEIEPTPINVSDSVTEPVTNYTQCDVLDEIPNTNNAESVKNVQSTEVIDQPEGTAAGGTEQTTTSVAKSVMRNLPTELVTNYSTSSSEYEEVPRTETSSSIDADSYVVNANTLRGALPRNLELDDKLNDTFLLPTTSFSKSLRSIDSTPTRIANSEMTTSLEPVTSYSQSIVLEENSKTDEESTEYVESTKVTNQPKGTARVETESTENVRKVPRAIGSHVFYGKMVSGSEMYNMTTDEYYNKIYPTQNCDVFLIGKLLKVADTPHNRMVFAKFAEEKADSTSDDSKEEDVPIDN